jgi:hypothetical protein
MLRFKQDCSRCASPRRSASSARQRTRCENIKQESDRDGVYLWTYIGLFGAWLCLSEAWPCIAYIFLLMLLYIMRLVWLRFGVHNSDDTVQTTCGQSARRKSFFFFGLAIQSAPIPVFLVHTKGTICALFRCAPGTQMIRIVPLRMDSRPMDKPFAF